MTEASSPGQDPATWKAPGRSHPPDQTTGGASDRAAESGLSVGRSPGIRAGQVATTKVRRRLGYTAGRNADSLHPTKELAQAGETSVRIHLVAAWRESNVYTEAERAAK